MACLVELLDPQAPTKEARLLLQSIEQDSDNVFEPETPTRTNALDYKFVHDLNDEF
jgi:hypothetical protein